MKIEEVIQNYFPDSKNADYEPFGDGATNLTYKVSIETGSGIDQYIFQKMNSSFDPLVVKDIAVVTEHLSALDFPTQRVVKTANGELSLLDGDAWWKVLTFIPGKIFSKVYSPEQAKRAGALVGEFHTALLGFGYEFQYKVPHFHDTPFAMERLAQILDQNQDSEKLQTLEPLAREVLKLYGELPKIGILPSRIIHGDLKISNVIFDEKGERAIALADLDTLMHADVAVEMGDALRSWCMPGGEDDSQVRFDKNIYDSAVEGYFSTAEFLTQAEKDAIPYGVKLITLELTARFIIDAFNENYWVLDSSKYKSLYEQNKTRAENQLKFFKEFSKIF